MNYANFVLLVGSIMCSGCFANQRVDSFEESDRMITRCETVFEKLGETYSSSLESMSDVKLLADRIEGDHGDLFAILYVDAREMADLGDAIRQRNDLVHAMRSNAVRALDGSVCGDTADEYLVDVLFRSAPADSELASQYLSYKSSGISYKTFLLLALILEISNSARSK